MNDILMQTYLYDFYGELLTPHQKEIYEQVVLEDYSLSEVAKEAGKSRQSVHDMIKRCNKTLEGYEAKLHLVEKFLYVKEDVTQIHALAMQCKQSHDETILNEIETISNKILEEL